MAQDSALHPIWDDTHAADHRPTRRSWLPKAVLLLIILFLAGLAMAGPQPARSENMDETPTALVACAGSDASQAASVDAKLQSQRAHNIPHPRIAAPAQGIAPVRSAGRLPVPAAEQTAMRWQCYPRYSNAGHSLCWAVNTPQAVSL